MTDVVTPDRTVPALGPPPVVRLPEVAQATLASGLRVMAVRQPGVPLVELRLRIPMTSDDDAESTHADLLGETFLTGTAQRDETALAVALQSLGGGLSASVDADRLLVAGSALAPALPDLLGIVTELMVDNAYPDEAVRGERDRTAQRLAIARSQPAVQARDALARRLHGDHPYGRGLPAPEEVAAVTAGGLRDLHRRRVAPAGSLLVLVGDLDPEHALTAAGDVLDAWDGGHAADPAPPVPAVAPGPLRLVDRPGAVQTNIRMGGLALPRTDPSAPALQLANLVFGGYFSSRLVANIRERRGYTYSPRSLVDHAPAGSTVEVAADVGTEVTAPALVEIGYELGRIAALAVESAELESARQYAIGSLLLGTSTQSGLASRLVALDAAGLDVTYLRDHPLALAAVTADEVLAAARAHLAPARLVTVLVGDAARIGDEVAALGAVEGT